jgi:hypothetical protein
VARFLVGLAVMKVGDDGAVTEQIIKEFGAVYDYQRMLINKMTEELRGLLS